MKQQTARLFLIMSLIHSLSAQTYTEEDYGNIEEIRDDSEINEEFYDDSTLSLTPPTQPILPIAKPDSSSSYTPPTIKSASLTQENLIGAVDTDTASNVTPKLGLTITVKSVETPLKAPPSPSVTGSDLASLIDLESPAKENPPMASVTKKLLIFKVTEPTPPNTQPPSITSIYERTKTDNLTFINDLHIFINNVEGAVDNVYHFLARTRNHSPIRNEFKELSELFYAILLPVMSHDDANRECLRRGARLYETSSQLRLNLLRQMKHRNVPIQNLMSEGQAIRIWLDVEQDPDGTLNFPSGDPILTFLDRQHIALEKGLPENHCLYYDLTNNQYVKTLCSEQHLTVCFIKKTPQIMEEKLFLDNINDKRMIREADEAFEINIYFN
jgi:hypothetical protein